MDEILLDVDGTVRGGTLAGLVEHLTRHDQLDKSYSKVFLTTFQSFTTAGALFDLLVTRFRVQPPPKLTLEGLAEWENSNQMRVLCIFEAMITDEDVLNKEDMALLDRMLEFLKSDEVYHLNLAMALVKNIEHIKAGGDLLKQSLVNPPCPIIPRTAKLRLLDIEPLELARQLTIKESELYRRIKPIEFLLRVRGRGPENIATVIQTSNSITDWVVELILSRQDLRQRTNTVKYLIQVAYLCRTLNNFSTMVAIMSGLNTPPIRRLKRTWERVNARSMAQFAACEATIDCNGHFGEYRRMIQTIKSPCVPLIGVFLSDLQSIHDKNGDNLSGGLINFRKRQMLSKVLGNIKQWQTQPFNLVTVPLIMNYIERSLDQFKNMKALRDRFWKMSMEREPQEREDEKTVRLLQESAGFFGDIQTL